MAQRLDHQALVNVLRSPPEQHITQLEQFETFMLGQRRDASEADSPIVAEFIQKTQEVLLRERDQNEALNRTVEMLSIRSH